MKNVKDLKVWQLYAGHSVWFFLMGIVFYFVKALLDMTFLKNSRMFTSVYKVVESIGTGQADARYGSKVAENVLGSDKVDPLTTGLY